MTAFSRIKGQGCGCDARADGKGLVSIDEALARIQQAVDPVDATEEIALSAASGRVLARAVRACSAAPPFDNAAMDGYALDPACLLGAGPWRLPVAKRIAAGRQMPGSLDPGTAAQIFTGAPIPDKACAVVMQEDVQRIDGTIVVSHKVSPGANIRRAGEDMAAGQTVVPVGTALTARHVAASAAAGVATVHVRRAVRVALLVTGDEVNTPGHSRGSAGIWDVNTPMLSAAIATPGITLAHAATGRDNRESLRRQLADLAGRVDLIVTTGGISVGEEDHVRPALADLGVNMVFSGVMMKPGKPVSYGRLGRAQWLGLPGNPLSAFITWHVFGTAMCRRLSGAPPPSGLRRHIVLSRPLFHKVGRCELRLAERSRFDSAGREVVDFADATHSGRVAGLAAADGVILIPAAIEYLPEGALVEFQPF